jgi:hypothetical protein
MIWRGWSGMLAVFSWPPDEDYFAVSYRPIQIGRDLAQKKSALQL